MKKCFIITPIGDDGSDIRRKTDGLIRSVIRPVLKENNYDGEAAHEVSDSGSITRMVVKRILGDELVIANLTGLNPNVMYELAIRHAVKKPVITIAEKGVRLPFDIVDQRTIFYLDGMAGAETLKTDLNNAIASIENQEEIDNPIVDAARDFQLDLALEQPGDGTEFVSKYLLDEIRSLREAFNRGSGATDSSHNKKKNLNTTWIMFDGAESKAKHFCELIMNEFDAEDAISTRAARGKYEIEIHNVAVDMPDHVLAKLAEKAGGKFGAY